MSIPSQIYVIVPCFNEKAVLRQTILPLIDLQLKVIVVDDCSTDLPKETIEDLPIFYLRHAINLGQGAALQTGMDFAKQQDADIVIHFDSDGQHPAHQISELIQPILDGKCDVVLGSRFLQKESIQNIPFKKQILLKLARWVNGIITGLWLSDAHNGFRALNKEALGKIRLTENRMAHATEILSLIKKANLRVKEIPVTISYTEYSMQKGQSIWNAVNILFDLFKKRWL